MLYLSIPTRIFCVKVQSSIIFYLIYNLIDKIFLQSLLLSKLILYYLDIIFLIIKQFNYYLNLFLNL